MTTNFKMYILSLSLLLIFACRLCHAEDYHVITSILYGESASDVSPLAINALLNTYHKTRGKRSLIDNMKKQSCAYRFKSKQYIKALNRQLNDYEKSVYDNIYSIVKSFKPNESWQYIKHESPSFYGSYEKMISALKIKWGDSVDYSSVKKIGNQYYFKARK